MTEYKITKIIDAINDYSSFSPNQKKILAVLVRVSVNNQARITISEINQIAGVTRATISNALAYLESEKFIEMVQMKGNRFVGCNLNENRLKEVILHYEAKQNLIEK